MRRLALGGVLVLFLGGCGGNSSGGGTPDGADSDAAAQDGVATSDGADATQTSHDSGGSCSAQLGNATVTGVVQGQTLQATRAGAAAINVGGLAGYMIAFASGAASCDYATTPLATLGLTIYLCSDSPGVYQVNTSCLDGGSGISLQNDVKIPRTGEDLQATSGTITIEALDTACGGRVKGSFAVDFSGELATGTFDTVGCGALAF
jgi:hypothetical protein